MTIPTEPIGSIPRPLRLIESFQSMDCDDPRLDPIYEEAIRDTIEKFEATPPLRVPKTGVAPF
jgi:5-methyltetrahydropteroyltriglutamate--homocysteine methyltransferase